MVARAGAVRGGSGCRVVVLAFDPHPLSNINPAAAPARLTSFEDRRSLLLRAGADEVVRIEPTAARLASTPEEFIGDVVARYAPMAFVEGEDFRFGRGRTGDIALLRALGKQHGFEVCVVDAVDVVLDDHAVVKASSTLCRWMVAQGRVRDAKAILGRPYCVRGTVVRGDRRGRTIGFPTANVETGDLLLPADGVYAAVAELPGGRRLPAAVNIGERPTFAGAARTVEAHVLVPLGAGENIAAGSAAAGHGWQPLDQLPEYGWPIALEMVGWVRDQCRFSGIDALCAQLSRDSCRVQTMVSGCAGGVEAVSARAAVTAGIHAAARSVSDRSTCQQGVSS